MALFLVNPTLGLESEESLQQNGDSHEARNSDPRRFGRFRLVAPIATTPVSRVFRAVDEDGEFAAVKILRRAAANDRAWLMRFYDQAQTAMELDHERLLPVWEVGESCGRHFQVMPLVGTTTLADHVRQNGPTSETESLEFVRDLHESVRAIHRRGRVHGRLDPDNILLDENGVAMVKGMASTPESCRDLPSTRRLRQSFCYYAPEQLEGFGDLDDRADVYSLTAILYFLISGKPPFPAGTAEQLLAAKRRTVSFTRSAAARRGGQQLFELLRCGLAWDPDRRPHNEMFAGLTTTGGGAQLGRYRLLKLIGSGKTSYVYEARGPRQEPCAVKVLRPELVRSTTRLARFYQEARLAMGVQHPHIVETREVGRDGDYHFLAMELIDGQSLAWHVQQHGPLPERRVIRIGIQIASALQALHRQGIVHRDVKPSNVQLLSDGTVKLADLGLGRHHAEHEGLTQPGQGLGTPRYMAPEQFYDAARVHPRMDVYSLGVTLYVLATGRIPFEAESVVEQLRRKMANDFPVPSAHRRDLSPEFDRIIRRSIHAKLQQRYASTRGLLRDLLAHDQRFEFAQDAGAEVRRPRAATSCDVDDLRADRNQTDGIPPSVRLGDAVAGAARTQVGLRGCLARVRRVLLPREWIPKTAMRRLLTSTVVAGD